ncbi:hypothetical protein B0A55_00798 [Friedmanniomyces simplex]|uniref:F-box domain-containing protein n=1 Tax=Friedmanniomyces simplex TaxID=329884 RepID=A0A4U0Y1K3_9PEZI|nr:hypothetical protein B0A55_00798 [Friedmanniomyces simplex]
MSNLLETKLPAELRLKIYSDLFTSKYRLTCATTSILRAQLADTSILSTDKLIHNEAVEVLYKVNTFARPLRELCQHCTPATTQPDRLRGMSVIEIESCRECCRGRLAAIIDNEEAEKFHLRMMDHSLPPRELIELISGYRARWGSVGGLRVFAGSGAHVTIVYPAIADAWAYVATLPPDEVVHPMTLADGLQRRPDLVPGVVWEAAMSLSAVYVVESQRIGVLLHHLRCWAERSHDPQMVEHATRIMVRYLPHDW